MKRRGNTSGGRYQRYDAYTDTVRYTRGETRTNGNNTNHALVVRDASSMGGLVRRNFFCLFLFV